MHVIISKINDTHLKKDVSWQKQFSSIQADIKELKANEARYYKNEGRGSTRESRRTERDSRSRTDRSQSLDRLRGITSSSAPRPTSTSTSRPAPEREEDESKPVALRGHAGSTSWSSQRGECPIRDNPGQRTSFQQTEILGNRSRVEFTAFSI